MSFTRKCLVVIALSTLMAPAAVASDYRTEVFGSVGMSEYTSFFGPARRGVNLGGGIGIRPFSSEHFWLRGVGAEFESNVTVGASRSTNQTFYTANALYHLRVRSEPYVVWGLGGTHDAGRTSRAATLGFGAKGLVGEHLLIRPELRLFGGERAGDFSRISIGFGYCW